AVLRMLPSGHDWWRDGAVSSRQSLAGLSHLWVATCCLKNATTESFNSAWKGARSNPFASPHISGNSHAGHGATNEKCAAPGTSWYSGGVANRRRTTAALVSDGTLRSAAPFQSSTAAVTCLSPSGSNAKP